MSTDHSSRERERERDGKDAAKRLLDKPHNLQSRAPVTLCKPQGREVLKVVYEHVYGDRYE